MKTVTLTAIKNGVKVNKTIELTPKEIATFKLHIGNTQKGVTLVSVEIQDGISAKNFMPPKVEGFTQIVAHKEHHKYVGVVCYVVKESVPSYGGRYSMWAGLDCIDFGLSLDSALDLYLDFLR